MTEDAINAAADPWLVTEPGGRRRPLTMRDVAGAFSLSSSPDEVIRKLMSVGLSEQYAAIAVGIFRDHNTLESEGVWAGVTARQKTLAMLDAGNALDGGATPEQAMEQLVADGYTREQATAAVVDHAVDRWVDHKEGVPILILAGVGVAAIGLIASIASASLKSSNPKIYIGAIVCGLVMIGIGAVRKMR